MADPNHDPLAEEALDGGWQTEVHRSGDRVLRSAGPQSETVLRLLSHLHDHGFGHSPRPIGNGFADDGREQLTYIEGVSPQPKPWTDNAAFNIGSMLRLLHDTTASFDPGPDAIWRPWFARNLPGAHPVIGHGDLGPWNILAVDNEPVAFIDWDNAGPVDALWELAQVGWLNAQLHDDDVAELNDLPGTERRAAQLGLIFDGYQLEKANHEGLIDMMIEFAIRSARDEAAAANVGPDSSSPTASGFPLLWAVTWRTRAAAWMIDNRQAILAALSS